MNTGYQLHEETTYHLSITHTFTFINPQRACAGGLLYLGQSVCLSVCVSVKSHLTSGASVRPENTVMYSVGGGQKICNESST